MKLKRSFTFAVLVSCIVILFATVIHFPYSAKASESASLQHASTPTISVSPKVINVSSCNVINNSNYILCPVTLSANQPLKTKINWTYSYKARGCFYTTCGPAYDVAVLPSQGFLPAASPSVVVDIIVYDYCYHGYENAYITFAIPGSIAKVKYTCSSNT